MAATDSAPPGAHNCARNLSSRAFCSAWLSVTPRVRLNASCRERRQTPAASATSAMAIGRSAAPAMNSSARRTAPGAGVNAGCASWPAPLCAKAVSSKVESPSRSVA